MPAENEDEFRCELDFGSSEDFGPLSWMVRPCEWYQQEYQDCRCEFVVKWDYHL